MTHRPVSPAVAAALLFVVDAPHNIGPIARVRPARVIRTGSLAEAAFDLDEAPRATTRERAVTKPIAYTWDEERDAWYAELRAKQQAVR